MLSAVHYLHKSGVVHRDIKPENILVSEDHVAYVADLGVAENFYKTDSKEIHGRTGTLLFMSPSLLTDHSVSDGYANDMWAVGVTLYAALTGRLPFATVDEIVRSDETLELPTEFGLWWYKLLQRLLCRDPGKRWTAMKALRHVQGTPCPFPCKRHTKGLLSDATSRQSPERNHESDSSNSLSSASPRCQRTNKPQPPYLAVVPHQDSPTHNDTDDDTTDTLQHSPSPPREERQSVPSGRRL